MDSDIVNQSFKEHARQYSSSSGYSLPDSEYSSVGTSTLASRVTDYEGCNANQLQSSAELSDDHNGLKAVSTLSSVAPLKIQKAAKWINAQLTSQQKNKHQSGDLTSRTSSSPRQLRTQQRGSDVPATPQTPRTPRTPQTQQSLEFQPFSWSNEPSTPTVVLSPQGRETDHGVRITSLNSPPNLKPIDPYLQLPKSEDTKFLERMRKRHNCVRELYNTEYLFAQDMAVVVRLYMCASADIGLSVRQIDTLFSNVPQVLDISLSLVAVLEANVPTQILQGDGSINYYDVAADEQVFVGKAMCLVLNGQLYEVYEDYIHHSKQQLELYYQLTQHLRQHPQKPNEQYAAPKVNTKQISSWLDHCGARAAKFTTAWSLDSLLIKPIQRLGKYPLFLQTLLDCTSQQHEDYDNLKRALHRSKHYLDCVNARLGQTIP